MDGFGFHNLFHYQPWRFNFMVVYTHCQRCGFYQEVKGEPGLIAGLGRAAITVEDSCFLCGSTIGKVLEVVDVDNYADK